MGGKGGGYGGGLGVDGGGGEGLKGDVAVKGEAPSAEGE